MMKKTNVKKLLFAAAAVVLCFGLCAGYTAANETTEATARNVITSGAIHIALLEKDATGALTDGVNLDTVIPGSEFVRTVTVRNTGDNPCWIRLAVKKAFTLPAGSEAEPDVSLITLDIDPAKWVEKDGFYYYLLPLQAGDETEAFFTTVSFSSSINNLYAGCTASVDITAQAVQQAHNGTDDVLEVLGWPETR